MSATVLHLAPVEATSEAVPQPSLRSPRTAEGSARGGQSWVGPSPGCLFRCLREAGPGTTGLVGSCYLVWLPAQGSLDG